MKPGLKYTSTVVLAGSMIALSLLSTHRSTAAPPEPVSKPAGGAQQGEVHQIALPTLPPDLPPGAGRDVVTTACTFCHSNRYITMQPAFSRAVWTAEVEKMRKTFGAPVAEQQVPVIVDYLMSIRGAATPTTKP